MLREKATKATPADDDLALFASKAPPYALDVVDDLLEGIRLGPRALAVASEVKRQHPDRVAQLAVDGEIRLVIAYFHSEVRNLCPKICDNFLYWVLTHSSPSVESYHERRVVRTGDAIGKTRPVDVHEVDHWNAIF